MVEDLRTLFTVLSLLTFLLIVAWAWRPSFRGRSEQAMNDVLRDDDRSAIVASPKKD